LPNFKRQLVPLIFLEDQRRGEGIGRVATQVLNNERNDWIILTNYKSTFTALADAWI